MTTTIADPPDVTPADDDAGKASGSRWLVPGDGGVRPRLPLALAAAVVSGGLMLLAFPPFGQWWLAPIAVALFGAAVHRRRFRAGFGIGMVAGIAFFAPLLSWTSTQVGQVPWVALSLLEALYFALLGGVTAYAGRLVRRHRAWWPLVTAALWTAQEALRDRTPFGGLPWGRLAFSQADSPIAAFAWLGGAPLVTFVTAACGGLLLAAAWRRWHTASPVSPRRAVVFAAAVWPLVTAALWIAQEVLPVRTPFGGFPWGRLAFSQADSPIAAFAWLGGALLVTFVTAACGGLLLAAAWGFWRTASPVSLRRAAVFAAAAVIAAVAGLAIPTWATTPDGKEVTIAVVQGSVPRLGLDFNEQRRAVLDNHVQATLDLAEDVANGDKRQPDVVVWPENASDIDPVANEDAAEQINTAADAIGVPIVVGTLQHDGSKNLNVSLVWDPATGPGFKYVKQHPVPFAEYIPMKPVVRTVAGWLDERMVDGIDRVNGFVPGDKPGVIPVGDLTLSGIICFEVAYDDLVRESVTEGTQILAVQTNNATFNDAEARQQLAMVQLRSIEHGRAGLMASTVGVSGFTDASGAVYDTTTFDTQEVIQSTIRVGEGNTPATTLGAVPELLACLAALGALIATIKTRRDDRSATAGSPSK